ncbi:MAG: T9SS type A sorting domain-containing protein [Bacteroidetes bacterium]|nr:T9SS type A sorting domain-containing protein [Bacteroidota bacterium]
MHIYGSTVGINEFQKDSLLIYPNPIKSNSELTIFNTTKIKSIALLSIDGKAIMEFSPKEENSEIKFPLVITTGVYV